MDPAQLKYSASHEWVAVEGETATLGISAFAVKQLTDLVYIELPAVGTQIKTGEPFGEVESVKAVSDLYAPVDGEVLEVNESLQDNLGVLSDDSFGEGWMLKIKLQDPSQVDSLMGQEAYKQHCATG
ncbi:Glycine cleavage system H protein [Polystyrenella longa]|uniref:Glycine cleavage system H protein n=1 Tax=Polystyrenella longa TaxID=2528007 RepID=A0A518CM83_9PLAN|nr:glycine cleavage system protein GcvH [Polystyrenella longa]QDU80303.1 Glycine cleavage system H protein [Polystyrenella longa]